MNQTEASVEFRHVSYRCDRRTLLDELNFTIARGETLVLLGRSGSGKTTTLKLINNLLTPTQGQVIVENCPTNQWNSIHLRRRIGYVIQEVGLFPHFTVERNVALVPSLEGWQPNLIQEKVHQMLHLVGLEPGQFAQRYPHELSGGQKQRVGVARALAADPPILLMDEPFGALDPITRLDLQQQFYDLQAQLQKTVILVTHDIQEALFLATRIGVMQEGKLITLATPTEFLQSQHPETKAFIDCLTQLAGKYN